MPNTKRELAKRLRAILQEELDKIPKDVPGGRQQRLAEKIGITQPYISDILAGKKDGLRSLFTILDALCYDIETLFTKNVGMSPAETPFPSEHGPVPLIEWDQINSNILPIEGEAVLARVPVSDKSFALKIVNDSMSPRYLEGDIVIVDPDLPVNSGQAAIIEVRGEFLLKQVCFQDDGSLLLRTTSDEYPDIHVPASKSVKVGIIGPVVDLHPKV